MIIRLLMLSMLLLPIITFAQDDNEEAGDQERIEQLEQENAEAEVELQHHREQAAIQEQHDRNEQNRDLVQTVADVANKAVGAGLKAGVVVIERVYGRCEGYCERLGYSATEHKRYCKAGHVWWTCAPYDGKSLHRYCCKHPLVWSNDYGCVEPGYTPSHSDDYDASGGSGSN